MCVDEYQSAPVCAPYGLPKAMCTPGNFSSCRMWPMTRVQLDVGADGELADAVAVLVGVRCTPEVGLRAWFVEVASTRRLSSTRSVSGVSREAAVPVAQPVADDAVDDEGAVDFAGRREHLAARQVAPLVGLMRPLVLIQR